MNYFKIMNPERKANFSKMKRKGNQQFTQPHEYVDDFRVA